MLLVPPLASSLVDVACGSKNPKASAVLGRIYVHDREDSMVQSERRTGVVDTALVAQCHRSSTWMPALLASLKVSPALLWVRIRIRVRVKVRGGSVLRPAVVGWCGNVG